MFCYRNGRGTNSIWTSLPTGKIEQRRENDTTQSLENALFPLS